MRAGGMRPTRSLAALAKRLGVTAAAASAIVVPLQEPPSASNQPAETPVPTSPPLGMMASNGVSAVPWIRLSRRAVIAARKSATR
jgi:hypothetical protein